MGKAQSSTPVLFSDHGCCLSVCSSEWAAASTARPGGSHGIAPELGETLPRAAAAERGEEAGQGAGDAPADPRHRQIRARKAEWAVLDNDDEVKRTRASFTRVGVQRSAGRRRARSRRCRGAAGGRERAGASSPPGPALPEGPPHPAPGASLSPQDCPIALCGSALTWEWSFRHFRAARSQC